MASPDDISGVDLNSSTGGADRAGCVLSLQRLPPPTGTPMIHVIKCVRPDEQVWLVRMSVRGVWGALERARIFLNRADAEACLLKLHPIRGAYFEVAALKDQANGIAIPASTGRKRARPKLVAADGQEAWLR